MTDHLNEKQAWFGSKAFRIIDRFFQEKDYVNNPSKISQYAQWATCGDGPALYSTPTPMACTVSDSDPTYIVSLSSTTLCVNGLRHSPTCRNLVVHMFKSEFVVKIMTTFLGSIKGSHNLEEGFPQGALGMTAIAVSDHAHMSLMIILTWSYQLECAFTSYHFGTKMNPGQFSWENCKTGVGDYIQKTISQLGAHCWHAFLDIWGKAKPAAPASFGESSHPQRQLYLPPSSSPAKA